MLMGIQKVSTQLVDGLRDRKRGGIEMTKLRWRRCRVGRKMWGIKGTPAALPLLNTLIISQLQKERARNE
jgi:hypothetical protein